MADTAEEAFHKGYNAGANRDSEGSNPYTAGKQYAAWIEGYRKGIDPDLDERDRDNA
jgi:ribosome modulation factor